MCQVRGGRPLSSRSGSPASSALLPPLSRGPRALGVGGLRGVLFLTPGLAPLSPAAVREAGQPGAVRGPLLRRLPPGLPGPLPEAGGEAHVQRVHLRYAPPRRALRLSAEVTVHLPSPGRTLHNWCRVGRTPGAFPGAPGAGRGAPLQLVCCPRREGGSLSWEEPLPQSSSLV